MSSETVVNYGNVHKVLANGLMYARHDKVIPFSSFTFNGITVQFTNWKSMFTRVMGILLSKHGDVARYAMINSKINDSIGFFSDINEAVIFNRDSSKGNRIVHLRNDFFLACNLNSARTYEYMVIILKLMGYEEDAVQFKYA
jgi:hypothetical protein